MHRISNRSALPLVRQLFDQLPDEKLEDLSARSGVSMNALYSWRKGRYLPKLPMFEAVVQACGKRLIIVDDNDAQV